ncbi:preprotein translocase subunit Tim44 [Sphingomonas oleivorans]|uniref:Preprotein translocase subunit Tim44 n=1 Tax=Sphingomonas oleivorans TaxID=1735121 RepID=A0A2T5FV42_9SPHN|nr:Tim44/TimA family putative adaptor protein [Sphingomonas oleivorans]PTQ08593.1 preprotein translocase subunit Tim44 [Sphingomonas oleivorans]
MFEIILLAMVFVFVGLRLWSVLGRRTGHEQPLAKPVEAQASASSTSRAPADFMTQSPAGQEMLAASGAANGLRAIAAADPQFDAARFLEGAQAAYRMILEAFWRGDEEELARFVDGSVRTDFSAAIAERKAAGHVLDNRLIAIERAIIEEARLDGQMALVTVRFDADIAAVTRDADGNVIAGSLTDAVPTHDVWTFSRHVRADDPNWVLVETDEAA